MEHEKNDDWKESGIGGDYTTDFENHAVIAEHTQFDLNDVKDSIKEK